MLVLGKIGWYKYLRAQKNCRGMAGPISGAVWMKSVSITGFGKIEWAILQNCIHVIFNRFAMYMNKAETGCGNGCPFVTLSGACHRYFQGEENAMV
jgi:hypothetical protein